MTRLARRNRTRKVKLYKREHDVRGWLCRWHGGGWEYRRCWQRSEAVLESRRIVVARTSVPFSQQLSLVAL